MEPMTNFLAYMCASINDKNCNYRPCKSFITQNHLLIYGKNTGKKIVTQGILSGLECGHPAGTSVVPQKGLMSYKNFTKKEGCNT